MQAVDQGVGRARVQEVGNVGVALVVCTAVIHIAVMH